MKYAVRLTTSLLIALAVLVPGAPVLAKDHNTSQVSEDRLVVQFEDGAHASSMSAIHRRVGATVIEMIPALNTYVVNVPRDQKWMSSIKYRLNRHVARVEDDPIAQAVEVPDDPYLAEGRQWGLTMVDATSAWDTTHSTAGIVVAILDTGIDSSHPDLGSKIVAIQNFSSDSTAEPEGNNHGTHVAGIAAACTNNDTGVAGLGYDASLMNGKVLSSSGSGWSSDVAQGIIWATDNGADVINMSLGSYGSSSLMQDAIDYAWDHGVVVVAAAGNDGLTTPFYPAAHENCIAVAATTSSDSMASFSNHGDWVDVGAPGSGIYSTTAGSSYGYMSGTSMASPFVTGLASLVFDVTTDTNGNGRTNDEVRNAIQATCDRCRSCL